MALKTVETVIIDPFCSNSASVAARNASAANMHE
jgi:hypothetical protein